MRDRDVGSMINAAHRPLVLVAAGFVSTSELVALSTQVDPEVAVRGLAAGEEPYFDAEFASIFLLDGPARTARSRGGQSSVILEPSELDRRLWRVLPQG